MNKFRTKVAAVVVASLALVVVTSSVALAVAPATTTTSRAVTVSTLIDSLFDGTLNVFLSGFNAAVSAWAVVLPILVAFGVGMALWMKAR